ncbi:hypothetical protein niasHT_012232 [Heterodera trifolii]|uniref:BED-type domain-containing protein n=1 Tax=Heterodera trifolii TaxID=157864 RepID=A0ABD2KY32_9BILA
MSEIWKFFNKNLADGAICKLCGKRTARTDGSTKGMWKHLEFKHKHEFSQLKNKENLSQKDGEKNQKQIDKFMVIKKSALEEAEECITRIMIRQNNSFYFFDDADLKELCRKAYPSLEFAGSEHFLRQVIPRMADQRHELLTQFRPHQCHPNDYFQKQE